MKVLLLGFTKVSYMPYMYFYIDQLKKNHCEVSLLYWDRDGKPDTIVPEGITEYKLVSYIEDSLPLRCKIGSFIKYRNYALKILKQQKFDLLIVLHSTTGIVLNDILKKKYRAKFILDYRDFTYENKKFYRRLIHKLVDNSVATFVSSDVYRKYLPESNQIFTSHNILLDSMEHRDIRRTKSRNIKPIRIRYWGFIRHRKINTKIIDALANDTRFELHYHGREQETGKFLRKYCKDRKIGNIFFHGEYKPEERYNFALETELLHNLYENDTKTIKAMGNKYYDGLTFYIPQLCSAGSFMGQQVAKNGIGKTMDLSSKNFADKVFRYYDSLNWTNFERNCDRTLERIMKEYKAGIDIIQKIMEEKSTSR